LLAQLHVGPPSSGQEPPSGSVYSCDLPWDHQNRRTVSITHGAAKSMIQIRGQPATWVHRLVRRYNYTRLSNFL
jgi:hypothetical protein